jgi:2'-5' RNA ligase
MDNDLRLFTAIPLPGELKKTLAALAPAGTRVELDGHLTLQFIGATPRSRLAGLLVALAEVESPEFDLKVAGLGYFSKGALWAGIEFSAELWALKKKVESQSQKALGLEPDSRAYKPHLTIARFKTAAIAKTSPQTSPYAKTSPNPTTQAAPLSVLESVQQLVKAKANLGLGSFRARGFELWRSVLTPTGAKRSLIQAYPFNQQIEPKINNLID